MNIWASTQGFDAATKSRRGIIIGVGWVDVNKADEHAPDYRPRFVGREFRQGNDDSLCASTPPLEALRTIASNAATLGGQYSGDGRLELKCVMVNDVRRAYFHSPAKRDIYTELPLEDELGDRRTQLGKLNLSLYDTRDAACNWQETLAGHLTTLGFRRGTGHPSICVQEGNKSGRWSTAMTMSRRDTNQVLVGYALNWNNVTKSTVKSLDLHILVL